MVNAVVTKGIEDRMDDSGGAGDRPDFCYDAQFMTDTYRYCDAQSGLPVKDANYLKT